MLITDERGRGEGLQKFSSFLQREREGILSVPSVPKSRFLGEDLVSFGIASDDGIVLPKKKTPHPTKIPKPNQQHGKNTYKRSVWQNSSAKCCATLAEVLSVFPRLGSWPFLSHSCSDVPTFSI